MSGISTVVDMSPFHTAATNGVKVPTVYVISTLIRSLLSVTVTLDGSMATVPAGSPTTAFTIPALSLGYTEPYLAPSRAAELMATWK